VGLVASYIASHLFTRVSMGVVGYMVMTRTSVQSIISIRAKNRYLGTVHINVNKYIHCLTPSIDGLLTQSSIFLLDSPVF